jgi:hypothetical protein
MSTPGTGRPAGTPRRSTPDPLAMTPAEKVAAEWEARHDVAARGHHASPDVLQHYLSESRTREVRRGAPVAADDRATERPAIAATPAQPERSRRRWWPFGRRR